jgi:hypothetical protein
MWPTIVDLFARRVVRLSDSPDAPPAQVPHDPFDAKLRKQPVQPAPGRGMSRSTASV